MTRKICSTLLATLTALVLVLILEGPAGAQVQRIYANKNCDTRISSTQVKGSYYVNSAWHGAGNYYVTVEIRWDRQTYSGWVNYDYRKVRGSDYYVGSTPRTLWQTDADSTNWGNAYSQVWRAHIISKLRKDRKYLPDLTITTDELWLRSGAFYEQGSNCAVFGS